jgi:hypothetical protein
MMPQSNKNPYEGYFEQINEEFLLMNKKLKNLVRNRSALGLENESILREFLKSYVPKHYSIGHGFIFKNDNEISNQCDILVYDSSFFPPLFKQGDFVVLSPESVMSVIEVKTKIVPGKSFLDNSIENIRSVRKLNSRISGLIFGYRGSSPVNIMNELTEYYRNSKVPLKEIFELMVNINMGYCIIPKRVDNSETLFNLDTSLNQVDTEFVFHVLNTAKKSFYLFFYYILRQLRTYILNTFINTGGSSKFRSEFESIPATPLGGLECKGYFDDHKEKIKDLHGHPKFDNNEDFLGILFGQGSK